jgi:hypothetical protein
MSFILSLMLSRILNIYIIKQRTKPLPYPESLPSQHFPQYPQAAQPQANTNQRTSQYQPQSHQSQYQTQRHSLAPSTQQQKQQPPKLTEYYIDITPSTCVRLRGMTDDLQAITQSAWLRSKTFVEGYLEAAAKLIVWMVAALSGNLTQAGAIVLMALLVFSSALLALSNSHAKGFNMRGRVAHPTPEEPEKRRDDGHSDGGMGPPYPTGSSGSWPGHSTTDSGLSGMDDWAEKGQVGHIVRDPYPFDDTVEYS